MSPKLLLFTAAFTLSRFVKFWKKMVELVEFVKQFRAHLGRVNALVCSGDGLRVCTTGSDKAVKFFDVNAPLSYFPYFFLSLSLLPQCQVLTLTSALNLA